MDSLQKEQKEFSRVYDQNIKRIYRFIFLRVNTQETAQDLTSETFTRAWSSFASASAKASADKKATEDKIKNWSAFLYQIARNLVTDFYREKGQFQVVSASAVAEASTESEQALVSSDLGEKIAINSDMDQVKKALAKLGEEQQEVIIWRYLDSLSYKEISQILAKPEGTVRVIVHRALEALRQELGEVA